MSSFAKVLEPSCTVFLGASFINFSIFQNLEPSFQIFRFQYKKKGEQIDDYLDMPKRQETSTDPKTIFLILESENLETRFQILEILKNL